MLEIDAGVFGALSNNCYLITDKVTGMSALVDCTDDSEKMMKLIEGKNLQYILLTHGHFDHIGGVKAVKEKTGARVVISKEDEPMLSSSKASLAAFCNGVQNNTTADMTVSDGDAIMLGESEIKVMATPGHTKGGLCYICEDSVFTGDTLFSLSCGRVDFPGGSAMEMTESLKRIASLDGDYAVYPGHDDISTLDYERKNNPYLHSL
ncbi:MAG: MBL fold metallo-hydrolase [Eubacterium sp.]